MSNYSGPQPIHPWPYPYGHQTYVPQIVKPHRGLAITALVLGICGLALGTIPILFIVAWILGVLALIFGIVGHKWGMGKAGIVLGLLAIAIGIVGIVIVNNVSNDIDSYTTCIQHANTIHQMNVCANTY